MKEKSMIKKHIFSRSVEIQFFFYKACNTAFSFLSEFYLQFLGSGSELVTNLHTVISGSALGLNDDKNILYNISHPLLLIIHSGPVGCLLGNSQSYYLNRNYNTNEQGIFLKIFVIVKLYNLCIFTFTVNNLRFYLNDKFKNPDMIISMVNYRIIRYDKRYDNQDNQVDTGMVQSSQNWQLSAV